MVGAQSNAALLNTTWGDICREAVRLKARIADAKACLDPLSLTDLQARGFTPEDAQTLKNGAADCATAGTAITVTGTMLSMCGPSTF